MEYQILDADRGSVAIMRVENGWLIRSDYGMRFNGTSTPLRVARTPDDLADQVREWAAGQEASNG